MKDLYLRCTSSLGDPKENEKLLLGIPQWRQEKIMRFIKPSDRRLSLGAWRLLEQVLTAYGLRACEVTIDSNGKPRCGNLNFNLSHSQEMVLCVVGDGPIGCDIEKVTTAPIEVAEHYFTPKERRYLTEAKSKEEENRMFFRLWTMKESYLKMTGEGLVFSPDRVEIDMCTLTVFRDNKPQHCSIEEFSFGEYVGAVCDDKLLREMCKNWREMHEFGVNDIDF